jgi:hypothetical protein
MRAGHPDQHDSAKGIQFFNPVFHSLWQLRAGQ